MAAKRKTNGHAKPEDFLLPEIPEIEEQTLPSGLVVKLRPPVHMEFWIRVGELPASVSAAMEGTSVARPNTSELIEWSYRMLSALIAEPAFSIEPKPGEFHPRRLKPEDRAFLTAYYNRHMNGGGRSDLEGFREESP